MRRANATRFSEPSRRRRDGLGNRPTSRARRDMPEVWRDETTRTVSGGRAASAWPGDTVSDVSARISEKVEVKGRVQSLAAQCAASLEGHPDHRVALMLAYLLGWESRTAEEIRLTQAAIAKAENERGGGTPSARRS